MMKKIFLSVLSVILILFSVACGKTSQNQDVTKAPSQTVGEVNTDAQTQEQTQEVSYYPVTITDHAGREVVIEAQPEKLVSGYYISTSVLIALGLDDKLVGIEAKAAKRAIYKLSAPELIDLPSVGTAKEFDLEGCAALEPDLVILPLKLKSAAESLEELGIDVILVNPESRELLDEAVDMIAKANNCEDMAKELADFTADKSAFLAKELEGSGMPKVYLAGNSSMLSTAGKGMYQHDVITLAGGENVAGDIEDTYWATIDYEQLLAWDPEYIILASDAEYTCEDVLNDVNLSECKAVKEGKVYQMPSVAEAWDSPVPSGVLGSVWLASVLHSDIVDTETCNEIIEEYYEEFYGFTYPQE